MPPSKRTIQNWVTSLQSWENGLTCLGECVAHFQRVEEALSICRSALIGRSRKIGAIVTSEMSFRAKVAVYSALCHHALNTDELPKDLRDLVARLHWAEQERNTISHSLWDASEEFPETIRREKTSSKRGRFTKMQEHLTPDDLKELGRLFEGIVTDLFYLTAKEIPKVAWKVARLTRRFQPTEKRGG